MRDDITSIPISEVFEPRDGCPICRLRNTLEDRVVEYITGAAMMEPDVRIETNKQGFCIDHYRMMLKKRNRLGVALILESHLDEMEKRIYAGPPLLGKSAKNQAKAAGRPPAPASSAVSWIGPWSGCWPPSAACGKRKKISGSCLRSSRPCVSPIFPSWPKRPPKA